MGLHSFTDGTEPEPPAKAAARLPRALQNLPPQIWSAVTRAALCAGRGTAFRRRAENSLRFEIIPVDTARKTQGAAQGAGRDELIQTVLLKAGDTPIDAIYDPDCLSENDSS